MKSTKKYVALILTLLMVFGIFPAAAFAVQTDDASAETDIRYAYTAQDGVEAADPDEWITVIVELDGATTLDKDEFVKAFKQSSKGFSADKTVATYREKLVHQHESVASKISKINSEAGFRYHYTNILNGFAATVQRKDVDAIKEISGVLNVYECQTYTYDKDWMEHESMEAADFAQLATSDSGSISQLDLQEAWDAGYTGAGKVVAIFDSSLRHTHVLFNYMDPEIAAAKPDNFKTKESLLESIDANKDTINLFNSDWGSWFHGREETGFDEATQAAIAAGDFYHNDKVPFAVDYFDGDLEVWDGDTSSHGTHVSGIAAGNGGPDFKGDVKGAAYDAQIMFFKIFSEYDDFAQESDEAVFAALDDAVTLGVNSFNLSLGIDFGFSTMQSYAQGGYQKAYNRAQAAGISVAVSAGNSQRTIRNGSMVPAATTILPNKYSVGFSGSMFGPMTVASAQGTGYKNIYEQYTTTLTVTPAEGDPITFSVTDNNAVAVGEAAKGSYDVVNIGLGSEAEILAAAGSEAIEGCLDGKVALVTRGDLSFLEKGQNAAKAGAAAMIMVNNTTRDQVLSAAQIAPEMPTFGALGTNKFTEDVIAAMLSGKVSFASESREVDGGRTYADSGPSSFSSWGVTEALELKPDIMTPGGQIWSAGASTDTALASMSGTSMASPNMCGSFIPVQQYVDANLDVFGVEKGTQEYSNIVNQLVASNTKVYARNHNNYTNPADAFKGDAFHSPRRQGAGMPQIGDITKSKVVLHNNVEYDPVTGVAPRTKVDLYDKLGDTFDITFNLDNYNDEARTFNVRANVQTDETSTDRNTGRTIIAGGADNNAFSFKDAVLTVKSVSGSAKIDTASENINCFAEDGAATVITVPAKSKTTITVTVALNGETMKTLDALWPNGMFLEGFVFFNSEENENVSIPYMGFRGDWNQAPMFDFASIYDDYSEKTTADLDYPLYAVTSLATYLPDGSEAFLGANQFSGTALPSYYVERNAYTGIRNYVNALREGDLFFNDYAAFSPNEDGFSDCLFANLALLRHAKAVCVDIVDKDGKVVATVGPDFDYFLAYQNDGLMVQQIAQTQDGPYSHTMGWDGKDADGKVVPDGCYTYKAYAIPEYQYLKDLKGETADPDAAKVLKSLKENGQSFEMAFQVDTTAPEAEVNEITADGTCWKVKLSDESGIQAVALYYDGQMLGDVIVVTGQDGYEGEFNVKELVKAGTDANKELFENGNTIDISKVQLQALDYAFNRLVLDAELPVEPTAEPTEQPCDGGESCPSAQYTDVDRSANSWSHEAIDWAVVENITNGKTSSLFAPKDPVTREQVVTFLWRAAGEPEPEKTENPFKDVTPGYSYNAILWAVEKGITNGTSQDTFSPKDTCTREQIVTFLWRYENEPAPASTESPFTDVTGGYSFSAILWAVENGITNGKTATTFAPKDTCNRAEAVTFLYRDLAE